MGPAHSPHSSGAVPLLQAARQAAGSVLTWNHMLAARQASQHPQKPDPQVETWTYLSRAALLGAKAIAVTNTM